MSVHPDLSTTAALGKTVPKEQVTPHKISVLVLLQEYYSSSNFHHEDSSDSTTEIKFSEKEKRNFMVTLLQLLQGSDIPLKETCMKIKSKVKPELYSLFLKRLQEFVEEGIGVVNQYFQNIPFMLMPAHSPSDHDHHLEHQPTITKSSVLGLFIRRMMLAFEKLTFSQMTSLYTRFVTYHRAANLANAYSDSDDLGGSITDSLMSLSGVRFSWGGPGRSSIDPFRQTEEEKCPEDTREFNSQKQAEYFILQQGFLLQHNENEALSPTDLQDKIIDMLKSNPDIAEAHFLNYLNNLRVKEYCTAFHNLFHYFDRKTSSLEQTGPSANKNKEDETKWRYAALNLAALHYRFGHREYAMAALKEAIGLAQDMNDNVCLQHALGWLHRLGEKGTARTENLLERAVTKSSELNLPNLTSIGIQAFARHNAFATAKPSHVFEYLQRSDVLNCQHSQSGFMCTSYANKSALWSMYGKRECMSMMSQLILNLDTTETGVYYNGESVCVALCNIARLHADNLSINQLLPVKDSEKAQSGSTVDTNLNSAFIWGQYNLATDMINNARKRFPAPCQYAHLWMSCEQEIQFDRMLLSRRLAQAEQAVVNLRALDELEAQLRCAILKKSKGEVTDALILLHGLLDKCNTEKGDHQVSPDFSCRVLMELSELYSQTGSPTNASSYILECITQARKHHLEYLAALGMVQLAHIQFQMQLPEHALSLLKQNMSTILSHGRVYDQGRVLYCYAKCQVAIAAKKEETERKSGLLMSASILTQVMDLFQSVEAYQRVKDTLYYQARLYHDLGYSSERNKCAHQYKQLDSQYPTVGQGDDVLELNPQGYELEFWKNLHDIEDRRMERAVTLTIN